MDLGNITYLGDVLGPDGGTLYVLVHGSGGYQITVCLREIGPTGPRFMPAEVYPAAGLANINLEAQSLELQAGVMRLLAEVSTGGQRLWLSNDMGRTWF